jgi:hypothetical protein
MRASTQNLTISATGSVAARIVDGATLKHDCMSGGIVRNSGGIVRVVTGEFWDDSRLKTP